jgi:hypothetical protein
MMKTQKPVHTVRSDSIRASIWEHHTDQDTHYTVVFSRSYQQNGEWKNSHVFREQDLMTLPLVSFMAKSWIHSRKKEEN